MAPCSRRVSDVNTELSTSHIYGTFGDHQRRVGVFHVTDSNQLEPAAQNCREMSGLRSRVEKSEES